MQLDNLISTRNVLAKSGWMDSDDRAEFIEDVDRLKSLVMFLRHQCLTYSKPTARQIEAAINQDYVAESIAERLPRYRESAMLMLLSQPHGKVFWDFARRLVDAVNADLNTPEGANSIELWTIRRTIRTVAPDWVFSDMPPVPTISKYARRTTKITSIMPAGSPGSGKKR